MRQRFVFGGAGAALASVVFLAAMLGAFSVATFSAPQVALAANDDVAAEGDAAAAANGNQEPQSENLLTWLFNSLGWRYVTIFLFVSFCMVALWVMNLLAVRRDSIVPAALVQGFDAYLNEKRFQEAFELAKNDESMLGQVLSAGMANISAGYDKAKAAMQEVGEEETMKLEQRLGYVALIAQIGPMFGLLGTVDGMVQAFNVIAQSNVTPKPSALAQGIGTALVTTVVGLWIAIPCITYYSIVRNRLQKLLFEAGSVSENLMSRFATTGSGVKKS